MTKILNGIYLGLGIGIGLTISTTIVYWVGTLMLFIMHIIKTIV